MGKVRGKLHRSGKDKVLGGVSGGLGAYFGVDPVIFRVLFVLLILVDGIGLIAYIVLWIVLPQDAREGVLEAKTQEHG